MISIVIPAYNEEKRLPDTLKKIIAYFNSKNNAYEIIIVDDGSKDNTASISQNFAPTVNVIKLGQNMGKGAAVRTGMLAASGDIVLFTDADSSTPIYEIEKLLPFIEEGFDVVIGSRAIDYSQIKIHQPFYREIMGKTFNKIVQFLVIKGIRDTQCGFKLLTKNAAQTIFSKALVNGFSFDVEMLYLANKLHLKIKEVPVEWYNDEQSKVNPIFDSINMLIEILKIKKLHKEK